MIWNHYIPLVVTGGHFNEQVDRQGSTILDFAGVNPQRLSDGLESIVQDCAASRSKHILVNIDPMILMDLTERLTPAFFGGALPLGLDAGAPSLVPDSTGIGLAEPAGRRPARSDPATCSRLRSRVRPAERESPPSPGCRSPS